MFPMSPAQAAILGRPAPVAVANAQTPQVGGFPATPAQIAALTGQTPTGGVNAAPTGLQEVGAGGVFTANPLADILLKRANRPADIRSGVGLLGRLAAQAVGTKIKRENVRGAREAALELVGELPEEMQQLAKFAVLQGNPEKVLELAMQDRRLGAQAEQQQIERDARAEQAELDRSARFDLQNHAQTFTAAQNEIANGLREQQIQASNRLAEANQLSQDEQRRVSQENTLYDDYVKESGDFVDSRAAFESLLASAEGGTGIDDTALIFAFMKIQDPRSQVTQNEAGQVQVSGRSVPQQVQDAIARINSGQVLSDDVREDLLRNVGRNFSRKLGTQGELFNETIDRAEAFGVAPDRAVRDVFGEWRDQDPTEIIEQLIKQSASRREEIAARDRGLTPVP